MDAELQRIVEKLERMPFKVESEYLPARDRYNDFVSDEDKKIIREVIAALRSYEHPLERKLKEKGIMVTECQVCGGRGWYSTWGRNGNGKVFETQSQCGNCIGQGYFIQPIPPSALVVLGKEGE